MSLSPLYGFFCLSEFKGRITTPGFTLCDPSFPSRFLVCFSGLCGACLRQQLLLHLQLILTSISHPLPSMDWPPSAVLFVSSRAGSAWVGLVACVSALQRSLWCQGWWGVLQEELSQAGPQETLIFCTTRCYSKQHFHHLRVLLILKSLCCSLAGLLAISPSAHPPQATAFAVLFDECSQGNSAFHMATASQHRHCLLIQPFPDHRILGRPLSHHSILPLPCSCLSELVVLKQGRC